MTLDREDIAAIAAEIVRQIGSKPGKPQPATDVPLVLREAAELCHVELAWLRERIARKEITAYRNSEGTTPWRVYPADIKAYLTARSNQKQERRRPVLKALRA